MLNTIRLWFDNQQRKAKQVENANKKLQHILNTISWTNEDDLHLLLRKLGDLFKAGADPNMKDQFGNTMLTKINQNINKQVFTMFVKAGADANIPDQNGEYPLFQISTWPRLELLIEAGSDLNIKNLEGRTKLYTVFHNLSIGPHWKHQEEFIYILLKHGADPNVLCENEDGSGFDTPLSILFKYLSPDSKYYIHVLNLVIRIIDEYNGVPLTINQYHQIRDKLNKKTQEKLDSAEKVSSNDKDFFYLASQTI